MEEYRCHLSRPTSFPRPRQPAGHKREQQVCESDNVGTGSAWARHPRPGCAVPLTHLPNSDHSNMSLNPCREFNCFREVHHYGRHLSSMLKRVARAQERSMLAHWNLTVQRTAKPAAKLFQVWVWTSRRQQLETRDLLSICESNFKSDLRSLARKKHIELCYLQGQSK